jgi:hypothetical protein
MKEVLKIMKATNSGNSFSGPIGDEAMHKSGQPCSFDENRVNSTKLEQFDDRSLNLEFSLEVGGLCLEFRPHHFSAAFRHDPLLSATNRHDPPHK